MHQPPPDVPANLYQAFITDRMIRTPVRFVRGILGYKSDPAVRMDHFDHVLRMGAQAPDFTLPTVDGDEFTLSAHRGQYVVVEFGSYTCPMFRRHIAGMADLTRERADSVSFVLVYGPEAHPNQGSFVDIDQPETHADRRVLAQRLVREEDIPMAVAVDEVPRAVSAAYGGAPNMVYVVDPEGRIAYKSLWTDSAAVGSFLRERLD